jgi:hypothetical protein
MRKNGIVQRSRLVSECNDGVKHQDTHHVIELTTSQQSADAKKSNASSPKYNTSLVLETE